jgi:vesicle-associated membrane protein-associated protein A
MHQDSSSVNGHPTAPIPDFTLDLPPPFPVTDVDPEKIVPKEPQPHPIEEEEEEEEEDEEQRPHTPPAEFNMAHDDSSVHDPESGDAHSHTPPPAPLRVVEPVPEPRLDYDVLMAKFEAALEEIEHLRGLLAAAPRPPSTELRRRNRPQSDEGSTMGETEVGTMVEENALPQDGVPLQVVVIIALGVFITTYLFF